MRPRALPTPRPRAAPSVLAPPQRDRPPEAGRSTSSTTGRSFTHARSPQFGHAGESTTDSTVITSRPTNGSTTSTTFPRGDRPTARTSRSVEHSRGTSDSTTSDPDSFEGDPTCPSTSASATSSSWVARRCSARNGRRPSWSCSHRSAGPTWPPRPISPSWSSAWPCGSRPSTNDSRPSTNDSPTRPRRSTNDSTPSTNDSPTRPRRSTCGSTPSTNGSPTRPRRSTIGWPSVQAEIIGELHRTLNAQTKALFFGLVTTITAIAAIIVTLAH